MELYMDEKWKLSRKGSSSGRCNRYANSSSGSGSRRAGDASFHKRSASSRKWSSFTRRCASLVKEQRARFYIMRRCVVMLICWREYQDG
ncbi:hypothetical protein Taro_014407 [Colocasia esculenta]|uniref:ROTUNDIFOLIA like 8 n=1 Tax=Colocasia esculenta TaxID=4460 RepID=A0A843UEF5_COLES|nr:hypothetical protein [Colocasia esculenta]